MRVKIAPLIRRNCCRALVLFVLAQTGCSSDKTSLVQPSLLPEADGGAREVVELHPPNAPSPNATRGASPAQKPQVPGTEAFDVVTVFWGSNRKISQATNARVSAEALTSGNSRQLALGFAHVTIPKIGRAAGTIQRPARVGFLNVTLYAGKEDPRKHFTIGDLQVLDRKTFVGAAELTRLKSRRFKDEAFVFIHGYSTDFESALFRTAQLAYDLEFDGVPYVFSWPSRGDISAYLYDRDAADSSQRYLRQYLELIINETNATHIHLIAHSMGTRLLVDTVAALAKERGSAGMPKIDQIILAAPDIDTQVFEDIAGAITAAAKGVTLYASSNDQALMLSQKAAMGRPRAGEVTVAGPVIAPGIDSIDITDAGFDEFWSVNHSTFAERSHIIKDVQLLMLHGTHPPDARFPIYKRLLSSSGSPYWQYVKN